MFLQQCAFLVVVCVWQSSANFINSGTPSGVTTSFDCAVRYYAYEYGQQLQSRQGTFVSLFDALQLNACNYTRPQESPRKVPNFNNVNSESDEQECIYFVDPNNGSDSDSGQTPLTAFISIERAIKAVRHARANVKHSEKALSQHPCVINLMEGTFYLSSTIKLGSQDSHLTIQNYNGANSVVSGGIPLSFGNSDWQLYKYEKTQWQNFTNYNNVWGRADPSSSNDLITLSLQFNCVQALH